MIKAVYRALPGPSAVRIAIMVLAALVFLALVIWSYELLGDVLDTGGTIDE